MRERRSSVMSFEQLHLSGPRSLPTTGHNRVTKPTELNRSRHRPSAPGRGALCPIPLRHGVDFAALRRSGIRSSFIWSAPSSHVDSHRVTMVHLCV